METNPTGSRSGWLVAIAVLVAPLLLVAGSWSEITAGSSVEGSAAASPDQEAPEDATAKAPSGPGARPLNDPRGYVALTYDDGPSEELTPQLLDTLAAYQAPATFFVQGNRTKENPEIVERELAEGHVVGNHTYDHLDLTSTDPEQVRRQLLGTNEVLEQDVGFTPELYRPPYDRHDAEVDAIAGELGLTRASWTYRHDPKDWDDPSGEGKPAKQVCSEVVSESQPGDVILMHDRFAGTVGAAPCVIRGLREQRLEPGRLEVAEKPSPRNGDSFIQVVP